MVHSLVSPIAVSTFAQDVRAGLTRPLALCLLGWRGRRTMMRCRAALRNAAPTPSRPGARGGGQ